MVAGDGVDEGQPGADVRTTPDGDTTQGQRPVLQRVADVGRVDAVLGDELGGLRREHLGLVGIVRALGLGEQLADPVEERLTHRAGVVR